MIFKTLSNPSHSMAEKLLDQKDLQWDSTSNCLNSQYGMVTKKNSKVWLLQWYWFSQKKIFICHFESSAFLEVKSPFLVKYSVLIKSSVFPQTKNVLELHIRKAIKHTSLLFLPASQATALFRIFNCFICLCNNGFIMDKNVNFFLLNSNLNQCNL